MELHLMPWNQLLSIIMRWEFFVVEINWMLYNGLLLFCWVYFEPRGNDVTFFFPNNDSIPKVLIFFRLKHEPSREIIIAFSITKNFFFFLTQLSSFQDFNKVIKTKNHKINFQYHKQPSYKVLFHPPFVLGKIKCKLLIIPNTIKKFEDRP